ncbi:MAG: hypothetical protein HYZ65_11305 [Burkholderiales bacterium]|nr:hypothetical protein [Burkholderiales bacterium]
MANKLKQNWSDLSAAALSEQAVRALHQPAENFRLYLNAYEAGQTFTIKAGHDFVLYLLNGACKITVAGAALEIAAGELIALAAGSYACTAATDGVQLVKVFSRV